MADGDVLKAITALDSKFETSVNRVHGRMDEIAAAQNVMQVDLAVMKNELAHIPTQPCETIAGLAKTIEGHVADHEDTRRTVKNRVIAGAIGLVFLAIGTYIVMLLKGG
jgi:hypothetical protein